MSCLVKLNPLSLISFQRDKTISCVRCLRMRKPGKRIPAFMNSGKGFLPTKLTLSGDFLLLGEVILLESMSFVSFSLHENVSQSGTNQDYNKLQTLQNIFSFHNTTTLPSNICFQRNRWGEDSERVNPSLVRDQLKLENKTKSSPCSGLHKRPMDFPDLFIDLPSGLWQCFPLFITIPFACLESHTNQSRIDLEV